MSFSNLNVLPQALSLIPPTPFEYRKARQSAVNEFGQIVDGYTDWTRAFGIVVPTNRQTQHVEGIDFSRNSVTVYVRGVDLDDTNKTTPDQIRYCGKIFNVTSVSNWLPYDNFRSCVCMEVTNHHE